jgi:hypothetical protein
MMFGPWLLPLLGAAAGALTSKKPLKGALLGAGAGYGAGLLGPAAMGATNPALIESAVGAGTHGVSSASSGGLLGGALAGVDKYATPINAGLMMANNAKQLGQREAQPMAPVQQQQPVDVIGQMLAQQSQLEEQRRKQRYGIA